MAKILHTILDQYEETIRASMARCLWVTAYADYADENRDQDLPRAGGGEDWNDVAPEEPKAAQKAADDLRGLFFASNPSHHDGDRIMAHLFRLANEADGWKPTQASIDSRLEAFGWDMTMQALGHGVSWFDDHKEFEVEFPHFECHYDGDELVWSGSAAKGWDAGHASGHGNPPRYRAGDIVKYSPTPASAALYSRAPAIGEQGTVTSVPFPGGRKTQIPGPGGGLVYVDWDQFGVTGISPIDLTLVRRARTNPDEQENPRGRFTAKGERMYEEIKRGYGADPRAAEIAARTVYARAHEGTPGLLRHQHAQANPERFTEHGERMYEEIKRAHHGDPRAAEIAARTVYSRAASGTPGLLKRMGRPPGVPNPGWEVIARVSADRTNDPDAMSEHLKDDIERTFPGVEVMREAHYPTWTVLAKASDKRIVGKIRTYAQSWLASEGVAATRPNPCGGA